MTGDQEVLALPQSSTTLPILAVLARLAPTAFIHGLRREDVTTGTLGAQLVTPVLGPHPLGLERSNLSPSLSLSIQLSGGLEHLLVDSGRPSRAALVFIYEISGTNRVPEVLSVCTVETVRPYGAGLAEPSDCMPLINEILREEDIQIFTLTCSLIPPSHLNCHTFSILFPRPGFGPQGRKPLIN